MKLKFILLAAVFAVNAAGAMAQQATDPVIIRIDGKPILRSEFEYVYNKNNVGNTVDKKTLEEYVDLFVNFKLKVLEAQAQGLDTTATFKKELSGYRAQLVKPYMIDTEAENAALTEAYNRMGKDIDVSHILFRVAKDAAPADTLAAYNKALAALKRLSVKPAPKVGFFTRLFKGQPKEIAGEDFNLLAKEVSEDKSAEKNSGHIGWITAFGTIYPFETATYNLKVGEISAPVRTQVGYHIIKVNATRVSRGEVLTAHIMKFVTKDDNVSVEKAKISIDSLYALAKAGEDFGKLASANSDDKGSASRNGELPWFGTGRMVPEFEEVAFAMKNKGDISAPVLSDYGWHIIKLLDKRPLASFDDMKLQIESMIKRDERANIGTESFIKKLHKKYNYSLKSDNLADYYNVFNAEEPFDSAFFVNIEKFNKPLLIVEKKIYTQKDFNEFLKKSGFSTKTDAKEIFDEKLAQYVDVALTNYEDLQLENEYPEFRNLVREYHDGILLFDISNREVWDKASKDTLGITEFFKKNRTKYTWQELHYKGTVVYCKDKKTLATAQSIVKKLQNKGFEKELLAVLNNDSVMFVKLKKGLFTQGANKEIDKQIFKNKTDYQADKDFPYAFVVGKKLNLTPEDYTDVRGLVTADYQDFLEQQWLENLRKTHTITVVQEVLNTIENN